MSLGMKIMSVIITVILFVRMIEIYLYTSVAPIPFATLSNREWGQVGNNYFRGLFALGFQGFFMMICIGIYSVLVSSIQISGDIRGGGIYGSAVLRADKDRGTVKSHFRGALRGNGKKG